MLKVQKPVYKQYANLKPGTLIVLDGFRLYRDGILSVDKDTYDKYKETLEQLEKDKMIQEVGLEAKPKPFEMPRTHDVLDQNDDLDPELFVRQKQPDIFNPNPPQKEVAKEDVKVEEGTVPDHVIDTEVKSLQDKEKSVEDGFEGTKRTISCVANVRDWRKAKKMIEEEINGIDELNIIIENDHRDSVVEAAKEKKKIVMSK